MLDELPRKKAGSSMPAARIGFVKAHCRTRNKLHVVVKLALACLPCAFSDLSAASDSNTNRNLYAPPGSGVAAWRRQQPGSYGSASDLRPKEESYGRSSTWLETEDYKKPLDDLLCGATRGRHAGFHEETQGRRVGEGQPSDQSDAIVYFILVLLLSIVIGSGLGFLLYITWTCACKRRSPTTEVLSGPRFAEGNYIATAGRFDLNAGISEAERQVLHSVLDGGRRTLRAVPLGLPQKESLQSAVSGERGRASKRSRRHKGRKEKKRGTSSERKEKKSRKRDRTRRGRERRGREHSQERDGEERSQERDRGEHSQERDDGRERSPRREAARRAVKRTESDAESRPAQRAIPGYNDPEPAPGPVAPSMGGVRDVQQPVVSAAPGGPHRRPPAPVPLPIEPRSGTVLAGDLVRNAGSPTAHQSLNRTAGSEETAGSCQAELPFGVEEEQEASCPAAQRGGHGFTLGEEEAVDEGEEGRDSDSAGSWSSEDDDDDDDDDDESYDDDDDYDDDESESESESEPDSDSDGELPGPRGGSGEPMLSQGGAGTEIACGGGARGPSSSGPPMISRLPSLREQLNATHGFRRLDGSEEEEEGPARGVGQDAARGWMASLSLSGLPALFPGRAPSRGRAERHSPPAEPQPVTRSWR